MPSCCEWSHGRRARAALSLNWFKDWSALCFEDEPHEQATELPESETTMNMVEEVLRKACAWTDDTGSMQSGNPSADAPGPAPGPTPGPVSGAASGDTASHLRPGLVTLVGAGPGDPDLLTLRAVKALRGARLVLYDHLVSKEVLRYAGESMLESADLIYVGKQSGHHTLPQEDIIELMVRLAKSGRSLVRLKGGDGFIFGRGGEEALALAEAGIPFEVIPGITAAQGAGAYGGIALTHRDYAATLVFATGHRRGEQEMALDWPALARPRQTVVFYMGIANLPLICSEMQKHGLPAHMPAALVEQATMPEQRCICGTLATLPGLAAAHHVQPPALIIVGEVVALQPQLFAGMQALQENAEQ